MNFSVNLSSSNWTVPVSLKCPGIVLTTTILTVLIAVVGLVSNALVIRFVRSDLRQRKSVDRLLLLHMSVIHLLGGCLSLPLFYLDSSEILRGLDINMYFASTLCFLRIFLLFFSLRSGHFMLVVLCFDRFQLITEGPQAKWLTYERTRRIIVAIYVLVFVVFLGVMSGFAVHFTGDEQNSICLHEDPTKQETFGQAFSRIGLTVESVISLTIGNIACVFTLKKVDKYVKQHIESVRATLGDQSTIKEIRLVRYAKAFVMAYSLVWIPFGVARALKTNYPNSPDVDCFYMVIYILSYSVFSSIPVLYIIMDRRIKIPCLRYNDVNDQGNGQGTTKQS